MSNQDKWKPVIPGPPESVKAAALEEALRECLEYVDRFADMNDEPRNGHCRRLIARVNKLLA